MDWQSFRKREKPLVVLADPGSRYREEMIRNLHRYPCLSITVSDEDDLRLLLGERIIDLLVVHENFAGGGFSWVQRMFGRGNGVSVPVWFFSDTVRADLPALVQECGGIGYFSFPVNEQTDWNFFNAVLRLKQENLEAVRRELDAQQRFSEVVEDLKVGVVQVTVDEPSRFIYGNSYAWQQLGYTSAAEMLDGSPVTHYVDPAQRAVLMRELKRTGFISNYEVLLRRLNGETRWSRLTLSPVYDERGLISRANCLIEDVSEEKARREELARKNIQLERMVDSTVMALSSLLEIRDPYTAGHQLRVAELAEAIAGELGFDSDRRKAVHTAGLLHDIGKVYVPAELLSRPGHITENEFRLIKDHPVIGNRILGKVEFPWPVADFVLQHHERLDGTGYPAGLTGDAISLEARIISVADVVEAMSSHRPYRPSLGIDSALQEIRIRSGSCFDPEVAEICTRLFTKQGFEFSAVFDSLWHRLP